MTVDVNASPAQAGYECAVIAEGLVYGTCRTARYVLGTFRTISPVLALRWLGGQALWIVDRLGLDPCLGHLAELRAWYEDRESQRAAHAHIKTGAPLLLAVPDTDCTYTLSVRSVEQGPPNAPPGAHRRAGSGLLVPGGVPAVVTERSR